LSKNKNVAAQCWPGLHRVVSVPSSSLFSAIATTLWGRSSVASYRPLQHHCEAAVVPWATGHRSNAARSKQRCELPAITATLWGRNSAAARAATALRALAGETAVPQLELQQRHHYEL
jgi:hypothetical protein